MFFLSEDAYDTELERMNASMTADNHSLQRDNKQLNALIKEYEQTLETVMSAFRNRAVCPLLYSDGRHLTYYSLQHEVEKHELELIKDFESRMLELQDEDISKRLMDTSAQSESLARLSRLVRQFMRTIGGEDTDRPLPDENGKRIEDFDPLEAPSSAEWALERECELARLERENEELRRMLGAEVQDSHAETKRDAGLMHRPPTTVPSHDNRTLGAALTRTGSAGPYGTFKNINVRSAG